MSDSFFAVTKIISDEASVRTQEQVVAVRICDGVYLYIHIGWVFTVCQIRLFVALRKAVSGIVSLGEHA